MDTNILYKQYNVISQLEVQNRQKYQNFKTRIAEFANVDTIEMAKALADKILPVANEVNFFDIGNAKCIIINRENLFRISLNSPEEFISYDFVKQ